MSNEQLNYSRVWRGLAEARFQEVEALEQSGKRNWKGTTEHQAVRLALGDYKLACFAEKLRAEQSAPWFAPDASDALRLYLLEKHHWPLSCVRGLEHQDFLFALHSELRSLRLTDEQSAPVRQWVGHLTVRGEFEPHLHPVA